MKDPFDMDIDELREEKARLDEKPWLDQEDSARQDLVCELIGEKEREHREAAESSIKTMY